ncbi:MAG: metalloregulator ArsR/SmtB family transcription factor [Chloroflexota bacterium]|nr:metalloregulator ArsR/SmtB family transcription factor [Chloroflexota bacterium]
MARPKRSEQIHELGECEVDVIDIAKVRAARAGLPDVVRTHALATLFSALADPNRVRLIAALEREELCVCDLAATVGLSSSATSHQLRLLRSLGLVRARRDGRMVYYALDDEHVRTLYQQALDHVGHGDASGRNG